MRKLTALFSLMLAACGGATTTHTCDGDVTGEVMGTFSVCNDFDQRYRANLDTYVLTAAYTELPTSFTWSTEWQLKGEPIEKAYVFTGNPMTDTASLECTISVKKSGKSWLARTGAGVPSAGDCTLTLSDVTANEPMGNVTTYKIRGTLLAHLEAEPGTGSTGTVVVNATLCEGDAMLCPPLM